MGDESIFKSCTQEIEDSDSSQDGATIIFIQPKNVDLIPFAMLQATGSLMGLSFGDYSLSPCTRALFIDGSKSAAELQKEFKFCGSGVGLEKMKLLSMKSYNIEKKAAPAGQDVPVTHSAIVNKLEILAQRKNDDEGQAVDLGQLCVIFHDMQSLTAGGILCKPADFQDLHNRLKAAGAHQLYFVNSEAEAFQVAVKPDLVFNINKVCDAILPTIRLTLSSSSARIQDTILPVELELHFNDSGTWTVKESVQRNDQEEAIKVLALMGKTYKQIADTLGNISASTVGRRLHGMQKRGEIIIDGHRVIRA